MTMSIGACFHREHMPSAVIDQARVAEAAGYDEFWVIEDCFYTAGVSLAGAAMAATESIGVGIGIMPTVARNPAVTAMEIATLAGLSPGRFHAGLGHGVQAWMAQMNERRASPLTMLEETIEVIQRLLVGERVTTSGTYVSLTDVALELPPVQKPPVSAGVRGPKSLAIAGRVADGTILADFVNPAYVTWTKARIAEGVAENKAGTEGRSGEVAEPTGPTGPAAEGFNHRITAFAAMAIGPDGDAMRQAVAPLLAEVAVDAPPSLRMAPFFDELTERAAATDWLEAATAMPKEWWHQIGAVGDPDDAAAYLELMAEAGVDCLAFFPNPMDSANDIRQSARHLIS